MIFLSTGLASAQKAERKNVREGNKLYTKEKYTESEIAYRKSLEVNPKSIEGNYNLGNSLYKQGKYDEAAKQYQQTIAQEADPLKLAQAFHNMGNITMQKKDYAKSVEAYKMSLRLNPSDDETRYNLALAQKLLQDQQQQQQDQDQNKDNKDQDQKKDEEKKDDQQQQDQQQQDDKKENKTQDQPHQNEQMSQDNAQQMLDAFLQDEKDTQEKVKKAQAQQHQRRRTEKEW
ncbi:tetratricopeptide repeat protein [Parabacteroides pacaensis]|uniref:tetratricopeptide repeat protein n=1 Tax=Parabacteroides pacaensis TaxID=2086575 RepID=UPI001F1C63E8|nr:tetratricopeptide repeat protein [Parabacteroides pacaensis]